MTADWSIQPDKINAAIARIVELAKPKKVIIFGSAARGETHRDSDLDVLVVTNDDSVNPRDESVRIRRGLRGILMAFDILVVSEKRLRDFADSPGYIYREVLQKGKVVYEAAG